MRPLEEEGEPTTLHKTLGWVDLTLIGVGGIIGAGIFVLTGQAAARYAGPAIAISFVLASITCSFSALCYAELSAMLPVAGSAYAFSSATLGEVVGWAIGWDLILEFAFGAGTVAVGWSGYLQSLLGDMGVALPRALSAAPYTRNAHDGTWAATGSAFNAPAVAVVGAMTVLLCRGVQESARFNNVVVVVKVLVLLLFVGVGWGHTQLALWQPFVPPPQGGAFGAWGVLRGSSAIFFSYIGFEVVATAAGEARRPQRDLPIAILLSLAVATALYVAVALTVTGLVSYTALDVPDPIAVALDAIPALAWLRPVVKLGALLGLTTVVLVLLQGQSRIFWAMASDGLLPPQLAALHPATRAPTAAAWLSGGAAAAIAGLLPVDVLGEMVSIGTLAAFAVVCAGVLVLRRTRPALHRPFAVPYSPALPAAGVATSLLQMAALPVETWARLLLWMALGMAVYWGYSRHHALPMQLRLQRMFEGVQGGGELARALGEGGGGEGEGGGGGGVGGAAAAAAAAEGGGTPLIHAAAAAAAASSASAAASDATARPAAATQGQQ